MNGDNFEKYPQFLCSGKEDSNPSGGLTFHKKSFSVSKPNQKDAYKSGIISAKRSIAEEQMPNEMLIPKQNNYNGEGQSGREKEEAKEKPLNKKIAHNRIKSSYDNVIAKNTKCNVQINDQQRFQAKLTKYTQTKPKKKSSATVPTTPLKQYKNEAKKSKVNIGNCTRYESNISKPKTHKNSVSHNRIISEDEKGLINSVKNLAESPNKHNKDKEKICKSTDILTKHNAKSKETNKEKCNKNKGYFSNLKRGSTPISLDKGVTNKGTITITSKSKKKITIQNNKLIERFRPDTIHIYEKNDSKKFLIKNNKMTSTECLRSNMSNNNPNGKDFNKGKTNVNSPCGEIGRASCRERVYGLV